MTLRLLLVARATNARGLFQGTRAHPSIASSYTCCFGKNVTPITAAPLLSQSRLLSFEKAYNNYQSNASERQIVSMRNKAEEIVQKIPVEKIDMETWLQAEDVLDWWASKRTPESVQISFLLLERLVAEQGVLKNHSISSFIRYELLNSLVFNWQQVSKATTSSQTTTFSPQEIVHRLDQLSAASTTLRVTGKALSMIVDITYQRCKRDLSLQDAVFAETLWDRMVAMVENNPRSTFWPSVVNLNSVLSAWSSCARPDRAYALLRRVPSHVLTPNQQSYNILLAAYARVGNGPAAERLLREMCQQWEMQQQKRKQTRATDQRGADENDADESFRPDVVTWNTVISAWAKSSHPDAPVRAQSLLTQMYDPYTVPRVKPDLKTLNTVLVCWARSKQKDSAERCRGLLEQMKDLYAAGELEQPPDYFSYSTVMNAYAKIGQPEKVEELFDEMYHGFMYNGSQNLKPNLPILTSLLEARARVGQVQEAWTAFQRIRELYEFGFLPTGPDLFAYNVMFACYFHGSRAIPDAAARADALLKEMKNDPGAEPDLLSYSYVLQTWLLSPNGADQAAELAREALGRCRNGEHKRMKPEIRSLKAIVLAFSRAQEPEHAEKFLLDFCELARENRTAPPDTAAFGSVVAAWSRSKDPQAAVRAQKLLETMKQLGRDEVIREGPDFIIYKTVLSCWSGSTNDGAAEQAYSLLMEMRACASESGVTLKLDVVDYNRVLLALAKAQLPRRAVDLLYLIRSDYENQPGACPLNSESYSIVLSALAHSLSPESLERVEAIFRDMDVTPNAACYECLVKAFVRMSDPAKAEAVLHEMWDAYTNGNVELRPQAHHLDWVEEAWSCSPDADKMVSFRMFRDRVSIHVARKV